MATVRAVFEDYPAFVKALRSLKEARVRDYEAYGPTNLQEIEELMPAESSFVRGWATLGGIFGLALFWIVCILSSLIYGLIVGGKPPVSNLPYIIPAYEGTILCGSIAAFWRGWPTRCWFRAIHPSTTTCASAKIPTEWKSAARPKSATVWWSCSARPVPPR